MEKLMITAAITGAEVTKEMNPNLPCTPDEQAQAALDCFNAGASIVHVHVRDEAGFPSQDVNRFAELVDKIRNKCEIIIQISTGGAVGESISNRLAPLSLRPEMASLNVGSINFGDEVFTNLPQDIAKLAEVMKRDNIKPELEVYDVGMLEYGVRLVEKGVVTAPAHFQFVMGTPYGISASPENLEFMAGKLPSGSTFAVAGIGRWQMEMAKLAIPMGGHVRCGFEDNIYASKGVLAESNAQLVEMVTQIAGTCGREVANVSESRALLGLGT